MATKNDDASSADSPGPVLEDEHSGIVDEKRVRDMKRKASVDYYDWPIKKKASKAAKKKGTTSNNGCAKILEQLALQGAMMIERNRRRDEADRLRDEANQQREREEVLDNKDRETMSIVTNDMSPNSKEFWKQEKRAVMMRRMRAREDKSSNTDWLDE